MSPRDIVGSLHKAALSVAKRQAGAAGFAFGMAKGVVARSTALAESLLPGKQSVTGGGRAADVEVTQPPSQPQSPSESRSERGSGGPSGAGGQEAGTPEPQVVLREPAPPAEPPVDIVEQVLAAEDDQGEGAGRAGEPKGASRDASHGDAGMQRAELEEIAEEVAETSPEGDLDLATPVGTTGADAGRNPDTAEADLQQPGTEPIVDPSTTKAVASEQETLRKASRPRKKS